MVAACGDVFFATGFDSDVSIDFFGLQKKLCLRNGAEMYASVESFLQLVYTFYKNAVL